MVNLPPFVTPADIGKIQQHALDQYPKECCGAITPDGYVPLVNKHPVPDRAFDCRDACNELLAAGKLLAVVHSHPGGPMGPSSWDMRQQVAMDIPWGLVITDGNRVSIPFFWGDTLEIPPLERRPFRHGPSGSDGAGDCYALIRDWYRLERQITLPVGFRDDSWWSGGEEGANLYMTEFGKAGFVDLGRSEGLRDPHVGDVFLVRIRSKVPNHGGVYVGNGNILHHPAQCLSIHKPLGEWVKLITNWLRYTG
jgi:proteasome lid subunit RPN8/RPN11